MAPKKPVLMSGMLVHSPEIVRRKNTTFTELVSEVLFREYEIKELEPIRRGEV